MFRERVVEPSTGRRIEEVMKEVIHAWVQLSTNKLRWLWNPDDVMNDGYASFYKLLFNDWEDHPSASVSALTGSVTRLISEWLNLSGALWIQKTF